MFNTCDKSKCCGCQACVQACPKHCINMVPDNEGFLYPNIDHSSCINCKLCEKVCPFIRPYHTREPLNTYAAVNDNTSVRLESSSGGVFSMLAEDVINRGGVVFGARFDDDWNVVIDFTETCAGLREFRGSKYVQASTSNSYTDCKSFLDQGRQVLYSGTPCQIAGLKHFLREEYDNLMTVDFVCHGVPSPGVWSLYLRETIKATVKVVDGTSSVLFPLNFMSFIKDIKFRDKTDGWDKFRFALTFDEESAEVKKSSVLSSLNSLSQPAKQNPYFNAFYHNLILRPSCYECKSKGFSSGSDVTIADFWGAKVYVPDYYDNIGTSLVMVSTKKGLSLLDSCVHHKRVFDYETIKSFNYVIFESVKPHKRRLIFFEKLNSTKSVTQLIDDTLKLSFLELFLQRIVWIYKLPVRVCNKFFKFLKLLLLVFV